MRAASGFLLLFAALPVFAETPTGYPIVTIEPNAEIKPEAPKKPINFSGKPYRRLSPCRDRPNVFGDRCVLPAPIVGVPQEFFLAIPDA